MYYKYLDNGLLKKGLAHGEISKVKISVNGRSANFSQTFCTLSNVCAAWVMQQTLFGVTVSFPFDRF